MTLKEQLHEIIDQADDTSLQALWQFWQLNYLQANHPLEFSSPNTVDLIPFETVNGLLVVKHQDEHQLDTIDWLEVTRDERLNQIMGL